MREAKSGTIEHLIFHNSDNGYSVFVFETADEQFTAVGLMPNCHQGGEYTLYGDFTTSGKYGEQFAFRSYEVRTPESLEGIRAFLCSDFIKGVGAKTADIILARFGTDTLRIIEEEPDRLTEVPGIGPRKAKMITDSYSLHKEFSDIAVYFADYGIPIWQVTKLYEIYGSQTISLVESNPYEMIFDVPSIGFRRADEIALRIGFDMESEARIRGGSMYLLNRLAGEGHVYYPMEDFCEYVCRILEVPRESIRDCVEDMVFEGYLRLDLLEGQKVLYPDYTYNAECKVTSNLVLLADSEVKPINADIEGLIAASQAEKEISFSDNQKDAIRSSLSTGVSVITGGPGTGKTTIINTIIDILEQSGMDTAIAAPTGRAAKRIEETSGYRAMTIHRLLEYYYDDGYGDMRFGRNIDNPLEYDAVVVDEASMIDLLLMDSLLKAIRPGTRLIIVGDADQLPSVGVGNVLRDIIESEYIHSTRLTEIFRQAQESMIVVNAHRINRGEYPEYNERAGEFFFVKRSTEREMVEALKDLYARRLPGYFEGIDPVRDIQVLTPVRKGTLGVAALNRELQALMNPPSPEKKERAFGDRVFREGDKVMHIKNNYQLSWRMLSDFSEGEGVFNGDMGTIDSIDPETKTLCVIFDDDKFVKYEFKGLEELELAYAVTVHKSQGSEFPIVIMPVSWFPPMLATRNLLYTAVTRARQAVVLVGSEGKLQAIVDNISISQRYSGLAVRLRNFLGR